MRAAPPTPVPTPQTRAFLAFEQNLDSIGHMQKLTLHQLALMSAQVLKIKAQVAKANQVATVATEQRALAAKPGMTDLLRSLNRSLNRTDRSLNTLNFRI